MAVFTSSVFAMRKKMIIDALKKCGAVTKETAKTLSDTGVEKPDQFKEYTEQLAAMDVIHRTEDGRYYVDSAR